jgi:MFS family permease
MTAPSFARLTLPLASLNFTNQASRTLIATIGPLLAVEFALSASELGLLAAMFFASYAAAQLPVGLAIDVWGARRVQTVLALVAAAGFALCALATGPMTLAVGRVVSVSRDMTLRVIGLGVGRTGTYSVKIALEEHLLHARGHGAHADLNARNILLSGSLPKKPKAWLLDVDALTRDEANSEHVDTSNKNRLLRSLLKRARCGDLGYSEREIPAVWRELFPKR